MSRSKQTGALRAIYDQQEEELEHLAGGAIMGLIGNGNVNYFEEAAGDIIRELFKHDGATLSTGYLREKIRKLGRMNTAEKRDLDYTLRDPKKKQKALEWTKFVDETWIPRWQRLYDKIKKTDMDAERSKAALETMRTWRAVVEWGRGEGDTFDLIEQIGRSNRAVEEFCLTQKVSFYTHTPAKKGVSKYSDYGNRGRARKYTDAELAAVDIDSPDWEPSSAVTVAMMTDEQFEEVLDAFWPMKVPAKTMEMLHELFTELANTHAQIEQERAAVQSVFDLEAISDLTNHTSRLIHRINEIYSSDKFKPQPNRPKIVLVRRPRPELTPDPFADIRHRDYEEDDDYEEK